MNNTTDISELVQSKALHKKLNRRMNDALGFQRTSAGKHTTISLSIDECKSILSGLDKRFSEAEALEKAQARIAELEDGKEAERREWMARGVDQFSEYIGSSNRTVQNIYCEMQASVFASEIRAGEVDL